MCLQMLGGERDGEIDDDAAEDPPGRLVGALVAKQLHHVGAVVVTELTWVQTDEPAVDAHDRRVAAHAIAPPERSPPNRYTNVLSRASSSSATVRPAAVSS